jgi:hypothetical protein
MAAVAYSVLGDTSGSSAAMEASKFSAVSFRPSATCSSSSSGRILVKNRLQLVQQLSNVPVSP